MILGLISGQKTMTCGLVETVHAVSTWGMAQLLLSLTFPMIFLGDIFISWPLAFTCVGCNRGHGERRELSGKVAPSTIFTVEEKLKGSLVRNLRELAHLG